MLAQHSRLYKPRADNGGTGGFVAPCHAVYLTLPDFPSLAAYRFAASKRIERAQPLRRRLDRAGRHFNMHPAATVDLDDLPRDDAVAGDDRPFLGMARLGFPDRLAPADHVRHDEISAAGQPFHVSPNPGALFMRGIASASSLARSLW